MARTLGTAGEDTPTFPRISLISRVAKPRKCAGHIATKLNIISFPKREREHSTGESKAAWEITP
jgi:hypothetical protein